MIKILPYKAVHSSGTVHWYNATVSYIHGRSSKKTDCIANLYENEYTHTFLYNFSRKLRRRALSVKNNRPINLHA
jgi:hypothetical protein